MSGFNMLPVHGRIDALHGELEGLFNDALKKERVEIRADERRAALRSLYSTGALSTFSAIRANQDNAKYITRVFKLMKAYDDIHDRIEDPDTMETVVSMGKASGFDEDESHCIYNLSRYNVAINNLNSQKVIATDYILSDA